MDRGFDVMRRRGRRPPAPMGVFMIGLLAGLILAVVMLGVILLFGEGARGNAFVVRVADRGRVVLTRRPTRKGFFDESAKSLIWLKPDGTWERKAFGSGGSGYARIELRASKDRSKVWVVDLSAPFIRRGAAWDLGAGMFFPEKDDEWPAPWAAAKAGDLLVGGAF